jgi:ABC-type sugar transport system ATPase subunit
MSTIRLRNLTKEFGNLVAVDNIDLDVEAGEVLCLLGPSGCGKTTTLRMIAGLERATAGEVLIAEQRVDALSPAERDIAMVFQFYALYPSLTVAENLAFPLHAEPLSQTEIEGRVREIAAKLDLLPYLGSLPAQLAEGEKQRVAVGRAIVRDPSCFLFDEPLSRLDVELRHAMRGQIKEVLVGLSKATVIVTHDQLEALTMADRIAVMRDGAIEQVATPHGIFAQPANTFVAGFIGTPQMNLLEATLVGRRDGQARFKVDDQEVWLDAGQAIRELAEGSEVTLGIRPRAYELTIRELAEGSEVTLGIRPRAYELTAEGGADSFSAEVDLVEPMGAETLIHMIESGRDIRVVVPREQRVAIGERVHLRCKASQCHVFDGTQRRMVP